MGRSGGWVIRRRTLRRRIQRRLLWRRGRTGELVSYLLLKRGLKGFFWKRMASMPLLKRKMPIPMPMATGPSAAMLFSMLPIAVSAMCPVSALSESTGAAGGAAGSDSGVAMVVCLIRLYHKLSIFARMNTSKENL